MVGFTVVEERLVPLDELREGRLARIVEYWRAKCGDRPFLMRRDFDPVHIPEALGWIRIAAIERDGAFRFRLYGTDATNPDRADMTGKTTMDYEDKGFADMVTRHYATVAADGQPRCWHIRARVEEGEYEYVRVVLPMSYSGEAMDSLLICSERLTDHHLLWRNPL